MNRVRTSLQKARATTTELGVTGLNRDAGGYVHEEFLPQLQGIKALEIYREMKDNDPIVGATLFAIDMVVRQIPWRAVSFGNDDQHEQDRLFLEENMNDMSHTWSDLMVEAMTSVPYGWAYFEMVYKRRKGWNRNPAQRSKHNDNKVGWRKFGLRSQDTLDRWDFDESGGISGMHQLAPPDYEPVFIPIEKSVLFRASQHKGNPEGRSALRNAYRPWFFKKRIEELEGIGVERDLAGIPMAFVDPKLLSVDASAEEKAYLASIETLIRDIRLDHATGIILPALYDESGRELFKFSLLGGPGTKQFDTGKIVERYDQRIAMTVLADFILLGHGQQGSFALASSRSNLFAHAIEAWANSFQDTINRHVVPRLFRLNGRPTDELPTVKHGDISTPDLPEIAAFIAQTAGAGMPWFPDERLEGHIRSLARLPERPPGGVPLLGPDGRPAQQTGDEDSRRQPRRIGRQEPRGTPDDPRQTQRAL